MKNDVSLKDIAAELHVSITTVHRALHHKDGVGEEMRRKVVRMAEERGYTTNYVASSLKRRPIRIAVVLPEGTGNGRYYNRYFWEAIQSCEAEANSLNVQLLYTSFDGTADDQIKALVQVYAENEGDLDGMLTVPTMCGERMKRVIERFTYNGVQTVLIDNDMPHTRRLCCIAPQDSIAGRLGAELIGNMTHQAGYVLMSGGQEGNGAHEHNRSGFLAYLQERNIPLTPLVVNGYEDTQKLTETVCETLRQRNDVVAFYSGTARETLALSHAVINCGLQGKLCGVGSDLSPESAKLLSDDVVQALINTNAYDKGMRAFSTLFSYLVKKIAPPNETIMVPINIIMKSNLPFYEDMIAMTGL